MNFNLQQLNVENIGIWPWPIKLLVQLIFFLVILFAGYYFLAKPNLDRLTMAQIQEHDYKQQLVVNMRRNLKLQDTSQQVKSLDQQFKVIVKNMPGEIEVAGLLEDISSIAQKNELNIVLLKPMPEVVTGFYEEQPVRVIAHGNYHQLAGFISSLALENQAVSFADFNIEQDNDNKGKATGMLQLDLTAVVYRYLKPGEKQ